MPHDIVCFHLTRLANKDSLINRGLIFSGKDYSEFVRETMLENNMPNKAVNEVLMLLKREKKKRGRCRINEVCFIYEFDCYEDFVMYSAVFGGEFLENALSNPSSNRVPRRFENVLKIGEPCVVEFFIPCSSFDENTSREIAQRMLEDWVRLDVLGIETNRGYEGRVDFEIPPDHIIEVHSIKEKPEEYYDDVFEPH